MSSLLTMVERPQLLWQLFNSAQSQQFTQLSSLLFGAYPLSLSNLMYSLYKSLSHLTNFVIEKSLTSFILVYYIKVLRYAVGFDNCLALPLFGKEGAQASRRQMKEGGRDSNGQSGRNRHNQLTSTLLSSKCPGLRFRTTITWRRSKSCRQTGRWLDNQSHRQAVRATDSWRE